MRVAILPTGRMEWNALPLALARLFPGHEFYSLPSRREIDSHPHDFPLPSFTSTRLVKGASSASAARLVQRAAREALGDRTGAVEPADMVVIVDDLELANLDQPDVVVDVFRIAACAHIDKLAKTESIRVHGRTQTALRERVSLHIVKPMIEGWLFADARGPNNAGVPDSRAVYPRVHQDPEAFEVTDPEYVADTGASCRTWLELPERRRARHRPAWLGAQRHLHPKAYLAWLCRDQQQKSCSNYSETVGGARALATINWAGLFGEASSARFARALIQDIADRLEEPDPFPGEVAPCTGLSTARLEPVLRNL
jgi:hypothetical protein